MSTSWHAGAEMARRMERAEALNGAACAEGQPDAAVEWFGTGCAVFAGAGSPLTRAIGLGMDGPALPREIARLEEFFRRRGTEPVIDLCPLADPGFIEALGARRLTEFNHAMARRAGERPSAPPGIAVRQAEAHEEEAWARVLAQGFLERDEVSAEELRVGQVLFRMPGSLCYWASIDGQAVAAGAMAIRERVALLFADGTPAAWRRKGAQFALIVARLERAEAEGSDLMQATVIPATGSHRNYERAGFQVCYTKAIVTGSQGAGRHDPAGAPGMMT